MGTVTGLTAERMLAIEAASVVDGDVVGDDLFLTKKDGSLINAGNVRGAPGPEGPVGSSIAAVTAQPVSDVGIINQIRAGRQLTPADFTNMGLSVPIGLWNLSNLTDASGNGRTLINKGAVSSAVGINGGAATAMQFSGSTAQALYALDTGASEAFRIRTGSWGCWFRSARRGVIQYLFSKIQTAAGAFSWGVKIDSTNVITPFISTDGTNAFQKFGLLDVCDDRYHFAVVTFDGTRVVSYVDGGLDITIPVAGAIFGGAGPLNIGGRGADGAVATSDPLFGRVDEAFVTSDVLSEEQVRNLYCASIPHTLGSVPASFALSVRRKRRGAALAASDFPAQPSRLHNLSNASGADLGSNGVPLVDQTALSVAVAGPDGSRAGAIQWAGATGGWASSDAGLPAALASRTYGVWFKSISTAGGTIMGWGTQGSGDARLVLTNALGAAITAWSGPDSITGPVVNDSQWHLASVVEDNAATDAKRKLYIDSRVVGISTVMTSLVLAGANKFRLFINQDGATGPFSGQISRAFVYPGALTADQIRKIYDAGPMILAPSPKAPTDHVEASEAGRLLAIFDTIESSDSIDLAVMA